MMGNIRFLQNNSDAFFYWRYDMKPWKIFLYIAVLLVTLVLGTIVHELSHVLAVIVCGGTVSGISFGITSSVGGNLDNQYVSYVAMAALVLPAILVFLSSFFKFKKSAVQKWYSWFWMGVSISPLIDNLMNFGSMFFVRGDDRVMWDLLLAMDYASPKGQTICIVCCVISFLLAVIAGVLHGNGFIKCERENPSALALG